MLTKINQAFEEQCSHEYLSRTEISQRKNGGREEKKKKKQRLSIDEQKKFYLFFLAMARAATLEAIFATICDPPRDGEGEEKEKKEKRVCEKKEREKRAEGEEEEQIRARTEGQRRKFSSSVTFSSQSSLTQQLSLGFGQKNMCFRE